ncbi:hypothetical protein [Actinomadura rupiterrae]|uniref:hypothetical protein n=1 Tax=Actinomadura rupiterrae TaxID=559627 RepID=UPI0020A2E57D|nr:hypothetical protein [Actinomadura rupiterrae]MCP2339532.1 hypothetical protein [Actinomadura rupiterrae]
MTAALVLAALATLFATICLPRLLRAMPSRTPRTPPVYPESMTAELDPGDEEYLAWLADHLWPEDEYLEENPSPRDESDGGPIPA